MDRDDGASGTNLGGFCRFDQSEQVWMSRRSQPGRQVECMVCQSVARTL